MLIGCGSTEFVKPSCSKIKLLKAVPFLSLRTDAKGKLNDGNISALLNSAKALRVSDNYHRSEITRSNNVK